MWFSTGFILCCSTLAYYILGFLNFKCGKANLLAQLITAIGYFSVLGTLVWIVYGTLLRWSEEAKACSGDLVTNNGQEPYQWKSGKFMKLYIWVMGGVIGLTFLCTIVSSISDSCSSSYRRCHAHIKQDYSSGITSPLLVNTNNVS